MVQSADSPEQDATPDVATPEGKRPFTRPTQSTSRRYVSRLTHSTLAVIMAGGAASDLKR